MLQYIEKMRNAETINNDERLKASGGINGRSISLWRLS